MLLVNGAEMRPLLINRGKDFILDLLNEIQVTGSTDEILRNFDDPRLLQSLVAHKIVLCGKDEEEYPMPRVAPPRDAYGRMSLYLLLSQECNLSCSYCLNGENTYRKSKKPLMDEAVSFRAIEVCLSKLAPGGELEIVFFGGEPLLNWPLAKKTITYCEESLRAAFPNVSWRYHITTNLAVLPDDFIEWVKRYKITVLCDIDGPSRLHDATRPFKGGRPSHEKIARNVRALVAEGIEVALRSTVTSHNVDSLLEVAREHKDLGGSGCAFVPVNAVTSDEDILPVDLLPDPVRFAEGLKAVIDSGLWDRTRLFPLNQYLDQIKPGVRNVVSCGVPYGTAPVVDVEGDVYPCIYLVGLSAYKIGNVIDSPDFPAESFVERMTELLHIDNVENCRECALRYICTSGCPIGTLLIAGNPAATDYTKEYTREVRCAAMRVIVENVLWGHAETAALELERLAGEQAV